MDRSTRFYLIGTLSGGAIRSGWIDRSGLPRSVQPAGGRSGPNGSLSFNGIDRHFPPNPPLQPAEQRQTNSRIHLRQPSPRPNPQKKRQSNPRIPPKQLSPDPNPRKNATRIRAPPQNNHPPASTRGTTPDQLADSPEKTIPPPQPAEKPHPNPRNPPTPHTHPQPKALPHSNRSTTTTNAPDRPVPSIRTKFQVSVHKRLNDRKLEKLTPVLQD